jgi:hypothetical protein
MRNLGNKTDGCITILDDCENSRVEVSDPVIYGGGRYHVKAFTQADITNDEIAIAHDLDLSEEVAVVTLMDELSEECQPTKVEFKTDKIVVVGLGGYTPIIGTWKVRIL